MTDANVTMMSDVLPSMKPMTDGSGAHMAEQVSIEVDRLSGTVKDGVEATQTAFKTCGNLFTDTYMSQGAMRNSVDFSNHALALLQVKTPADAFKLDIEFMQRQMSSMQDRLLEATGVKQAPADVGARPSDGRG